MAARRNYLHFFPDVLPVRNKIRGWTVDVDRFPWMTVVWSDSSCYIYQPFCRDSKVPIHTAGPLLPQFGFWPIRRGGGWRERSFQIKWILSMLWNLVNGRWYIIISQKQHNGISCQSVLASPNTGIHVLPGQDQLRRTSHTFLADPIFSFWEQPVQMTLMKDHVFNLSH